MDEENTGLIGAEAEALAEGEEADKADRAALKAIAGDEGDDDGDDDAGAAGAAEGEENEAAAEGEGDDEEGAADDGAAAGDEADGADAGAAAEAADAPVAAAALGYMNVPEVTGLVEEKESIPTKRSELRQKYADGDLSRDELDAELDKLADRLADINSSLNEATSAIRFNQQVDVANYRGLIAAVKSEAKGDGVDYDANPALMGMWDARVRGMGNDPKLATKGDAWILREAHKQVIAEVKKVATSLGLKPGDAKDEKKVDTTAARKAAIDARKPADTKVKSLATVPQAAREAGGDGAEFAALDKLDGLALERALAKLTPEAAMRYLDRT